MIKHPFWLRPTLFAACFALVCTLGINSVSLHLLGAGQLNVLQLSGDTVDEAYYFAMIRSVAAGNLSLGNVSLKEHRADTIAPGYGPLFQGVFMSVFRVSLPIGILAGDLFFSFLCIFLLWSTVWKLFRSYPETFIVSWWIVSLMGFHLLRSISPQVTYLAFVCHLFLFLGTKQSWRTIGMRGLLTAVQFFLNPVLAVYSAACDGCDAVYHAWRLRSIRSFLTRCTLSFGPLLFAGIAKFLLPFQHGDSLAIADTYRRLGTIHSHLPASPLQQGMLLAALAALFFVIRQKKVSTQSTALRLLLCVIAGLLVLNQSVVHGIDVIFGLYYREPLQIVLRLVIAFLLLRAIPSRAFRRLLLCGLFVLSTYTLTQTVRLAWKDTVHMSIPPSTIAVIEWLHAQPSSLVIAAPEAVANLIPVESGHYVLYNTYARFQVASDAELAERFIAQRALFATPVDATYGNVLGLYAGNLAARRRTFCQILSFVTRAGTACGIDIRQAVYHQDVLKTLDSNPASVLPLLQKYHTNEILSDQPIPPDVLAACPFQQLIGQYSLYTCRPSST